MTSHQRAHEGHSLAHAARQGVGVVTQELAQAVLLGHSSGLGTVVLVHAPGEARRHGDVLLHGAPWHQQVLLQHVAHVTRGARDHLVGDLYLAGVGFQESGNVVEQRRLSTTRWAHDRDEGAVLDVERRWLESERGTEGFADVTQLQEFVDTHATNVTGPSRSNLKGSMALSIGIVGLPNVGKSTLFNALTNNNVLAANYPFATIEPNIGVVAVPDGRLAKLAEVFHSQRVLPAVVTFVDIAGIVRGASEGEGLGNQFLAAIRESDAICEVVRVFVDDDVIHIDGKIDPASDVATIETELILADLQTIEKAVTRLEKEARRSSEAVVKLAEVQKAQKALNELG